MEMNLVVAAPSEDQLADEIGAGIIAVSESAELLNTLNCAIAPKSYRQLAEIPQK
jgi:hypothetical protein